MKEFEEKDVFYGERIIPNKTTPNYLIKEHLLRYLFAKKYAQGKTVLDLACGTGYGSFELKKSGAKKVIGGDISKKALNYARKNYKKKGLIFKKLDGEKIDLSNGSVDLVISLETIEHLENPLKFLKEVKRVLKKKGLFICSSPNKRVTSPLSKKPLNKYHLKEFYIGELLELLKKNKLFPREVFGQCFIKIDLKFKVKKLIATYLPSFVSFLRRIIKKKNVQIDKNLGSIKKIKRGGLDPTYFIIISQRI